MKDDEIGRVCSMYGKEERNTYGFGGEMKERDMLEDLSLVWDNIKMDLKTGWNGVVIISLRMWATCRLL
jgi:hypothetical protein